MFRSASLLAMCVAMLGCGERRLELGLTLESATCMATDIAAGGSLLYEVSAGGTVAADGGIRSFCGGCLPVPAALSGKDAILAFLRLNAPTCPGVQPDSALLVRLTGWSVAACPPASMPVLCAVSPVLSVPDGRSDGRVEAPLACTGNCGSTCIPTSCAAQGKNCGFLSDGCALLLDCGLCTPPEKCGKGGVPNVCSR